MSRAFVKEPEGADAFEDLPDRPVSPHPNFVTAQGLEQLEAARAHWQQEHAGAQAANDRARLARAARELRYWSARRASAQLVAAPEDAAQVQFGSTVTLGRDDGRRQVFWIVGEDEADPVRGLLSHVAPLARALAGREVGDLVRAGGSEAEVLAIG